MQVYKRRPNPFSGIYCGLRFSLRVVRIKIFLAPCHLLYPNESLFLVAFSLDELNSTNYSISMIKLSVLINYNVYPRRLVSLIQLPHLIRFSNNLHWKKTCFATVTCSAAGRPRRFCRSLVLINVIIAANRHNSREMHFCAPRNGQIMKNSLWGKFCSIKFRFYSPIIMNFYYGIIVVRTISPTFSESCVINFGFKLGLNWMQLVQPPFWRI